MTTLRVTAVVINWRRPANLPRILHALRHNTLPCRLVVVDASRQSFSDLSAADEVIRLSVNRGGFNRLVPALAFDTEFTYFHDDDMLPGPQALAALVQCMDNLAGRNTAALGQLGRVYAGGQFNANEVLRRHGVCVNVDNVIRGVLVRTATLPDVHRFWRNQGRRFATPEGLVHDDLLLSFGLLEAGHLLRLMPACPLGETRVNQEELPAADALCYRPAHAAERQRIIGWFDNTVPGRLTPPWKMTVP